MHARASEFTAAVGIGRRLIQALLATYHSTARSLGATDRPVPSLSRSGLRRCSRYLNTSTILARRCLRTALMPVRRSMGIDFD